jgi:hypothetical protein
LAPPNRPQRLRIQFPAEGDVFKIDPQAAKGSQGILLKTNDGPGSELAVWRVDGAAVGVDGQSPWWMLQPGWHEAVLGRMNQGQYVKVNSVSFRVLK